jgi:hypothetical protein
MNKEENKTAINKKLKIKAIIEDGLQFYVNCDSDSSSENDYLYTENKKNEKNIKKSKIEKKTR